MLVPLERLKPNPWNPNKVAKPEMALLEVSICKSGFCFPVVVIADGADYVIVDGFHRHLVARKLKMAQVPVVVLDAPVTELMSATIRFNRARGTHQVDRTAAIVADMVAAGLSAEEVIKNLGMDGDEYLRLKQHAGIAEKYRDVPWSRSWEPGGNEEL